MDHRARKRRLRALQRDGMPRERTREGVVELRAIQFEEFPSWTRNREEEEEIVVEEGTDDVSLATIPEGIETDSSSDEFLG